MSDDEEPVSAFLSGEHARVWDSIVVVKLAQISFSHSQLEVHF